MKRLSQMSLRGKILGLVIVGMAVLSASAFVSLKLLASAYKTSLMEEFSDAASTIGDRIGAQFFERYGDVQAFAMNPAVRSMDGAKLPALLDDYVKLYGIYDLILVVDKNGSPIASNLKDTAGKPVNVSSLSKMSFKDAEWFKAVMSGKTTDDKSAGYSGTYFESLTDDQILANAFGEKRFASGFSTAIKNERGDVVGVITNRANTRWFEADLADMLNGYRDQHMQTPRIFILDSQGAFLFEHGVADGKEVDHDEKTLLKRNFVAEGNPAAIASVNQGATGHLEMNDEHGVPVIVGYHRIDNIKFPKALNWNVLVTLSAEEGLAAEGRAEKVFYILLATCAVISIGGVFYTAVKIAKSVGAVSVTLDKNGSEVADAAQKIASSATQLSEASTEQAAALQETVAAVDEISAMVDKNADSAQRSKQSSAQSRQAAEDGRRTVEQMLQAIDDINQSNADISQQMDESNRQLAEITKLISDIGSKTKVINEIVFQTKLLSFNASVEAARAGEYGKGFAVVAEEVGNLAEMSGSAAKEITALLDESTRKVDSIVSETKMRVERSMNSAREKVAAGSATAKEVNQSLEEILRHVEEVDGLVSEIAVASSEQATGIREISKAVGQMEQVVQQNSAVAQSSSVAAEQLSRQSTELNSMVGELKSIVQGGDGVVAATHPPKTAHRALRTSYR